MTTIHMFKNHPNRKNIKFVVLPLCHEILRSTSDIPMNVFKLMDIWNSEETEKYGITFDWSLIFLNSKPELWILNTLTDIKRR